MRVAAMRALACLLSASDKGESPEVLARLGAEVERQRDSLSKSDQLFFDRVADHCENYLTFRSAMTSVYVADPSPVDEVRAWFRPAAPAWEGVDYDREISEDD